MKIPTNLLGYYFSVPTYSLFRDINSYVNKKLFVLNVFIITCVCVCVCNCSDFGIESNLYTSLTWQVLIYCLFSLKSIYIYIQIYLLNIVYQLSTMKHVISYLHLQTLKFEPMTLKQLNIFPCVDSNIIRVCVLYVYSSSFI